jgi:hypothetical protein
VSLATDTSSLIEQQSEQMNAIEQAILRVIHDHGGYQMPLPILIGTLRIIEHCLIKRAESAIERAALDKLQ